MSHFNLDMHQNNAFLKKIFQIIIVGFEDCYQMSYLNFGSEAHTLDRLIFIGRNVFQNKNFKRYFAPVKGGLAKNY